MVKPKQTTDEHEDKHAQHILRLFLKIFIFQLKRQSKIAPNLAPNSISYQIRRVASNPDASEHIYEMSVSWRQGMRSNIVHRKEKRRITLGMLGEGGSSKSKCYKVIYDDILVAKIPPAPVSHFSDYLQNLHFERKVTKKLPADIDFLVPTVSPVLKLLYPNPEVDDTEDVEIHYIKLLKRKTWLQKYLRIKDSFIFFMDLSHYSFFSDVIKAMHELNTGEIYAELIETLNIMPNLEAFEGKFGIDHFDIFSEFNQVLKDYYETIERVKQGAGFSQSAYRYEKDRLFIDFIARRKKSTRDLRLNRQIKSIVKANRQTIVNYKQLVVNYIRAEKFKSNKDIMINIIERILDLVATLRARGVAIRDLKPDNIYLIHHTEHLPDMGANYLNYLLKKAEMPEQTDSIYKSVGLIDFETAVSLAKTGMEIEQPIPGGTFLYATPSNFFSNRSLMTVYKDLGMILYLQDWFATIGMIYYVIVGDDLFKKTGELLAKLVALKRYLIMKNELPPDYYKICSQRFWPCAIEEFQEKTDEHHSQLNSVSITLPANYRNLLAGQVHSYFTGVETRYGRVQKKQVMERISRGSGRYGEKQVPTFLLLHVMFDIARRCMYKAEWDVATVAVEEKLDQMDVASQTMATASTMLFDDTIVTGE